MSDMIVLPNDCHKTTRIVADYWTSIHPAPDALPGRRHFDPLDLPAEVWPFLILSQVEADPFDVLYKVVGTEIVKLNGHDTTGMRLSERTARRGHDDIIADYRVAVERRSVSYRRLKVFDAQRGFDLAIERAHFPLAANGNDVDMILTTMVKLDREFGAPQA